MAWGRTRKLVHSEDARAPRRARNTLARLYHEPASRPANGLRRTAPPVQTVGLGGGFRLANDGQRRGANWSGETRMLAVQTRTPSKRRARGTVAGETHS